MDLRRHIFFDGAPIYLPIVDINGNTIYFNQERWAADELNGRSRKRAATTTVDLRTPGIYGGTDQRLADVEMWKAESRPNTARANG